MVARRVLHIVENLNRGAVENWLIRMLRHANARGIEMDWTFYCVLPEPGALDQEAVELGSRVLRSPVPIGRNIAFLRALRAELRRGRYNVLHCHHDVMNAAYLITSAGLGIERRIVHVHNADEHIPTPNLLKQRLAREPMRRICLGLGDRIVGISDHTLDTFLAGRARRPGRDIVHYYGIDPAPFRAAKADRAAFRRELGLAEDARLFLFCGRLVPEKNPLFAVDVLAELRRMDPNVVGVFAGSGSLEATVSERAHLLGLAPHFRALGWRDDIAEIMSCCDWFVLPRPERPMEGFGIAVVEAQLGGLRLLLSRGIADDPLLQTAAARRLPLAAGASAWAQAAAEMMQQPAPSRSKVLADLRASPMDMDRALAHLLEIHG